MKVHVYRNLTRGGYSVKNPKTGLVIARRKCITLTDVEFKVSPAGRKRAVRVGQRNVHAYAVGYILRKNKKVSSRYKQITYNPFKNKSFVTSEGRKKVLSARICILGPMGAFILE